MYEDFVDIVFSACRFNESIEDIFKKGFKYVFSQDVYNDLCKIESISSLQEEIKKHLPYLRTNMWAINGINPQNLPSNKLSQKIIEKALGIVFSYWSNNNIYQDDNALSHKIAIGVITSKTN